MSYTHGEYVPELGGWYDASRKGCVDSPAKVTPMRDTTRRIARPLAGAEFRSDVPTTAELRSRGNADAFRPDESLERLRRLRDSEKPEDRERFDRLAAGRQRMSLGSYEANLRDYLAAGNDLPEGVTAPKER
jgi:hypothetical protein